MSDEFQLKVKAVLDTSDLKRLPAAAAQAATDTQQKLASIGGAAGRSNNLVEVAPGRFTLGGAPSPVPSTFGSTINQIGGRGLTPQQAAAHERQIAGARLREMAAFAGQSHALSERIAEREGQIRIEAVKKTEVRAIQAREEVHRGRGAGESAGLGAFRGFAQGVTSGTGVNVPFLGLGPAFIAGGVLASSLVVGVKAAFEAVNQLASGVVHLREVAGGSITNAARLSATARTFGVDATDAAAGVSELRKRVFDGDPVFARLGVSVRGANDELRDSGAIYDDVVTRIQAIRDPTLKASAAYDVFGASYSKLMPLLSQTPQVMAANTESISKQTEASRRAAQLVAQNENRTQRFKNAVGDVFSGLGSRFQENIAATVGQFDAMAKHAAEAEAYDRANAEALGRGASSAEAQAAAIAASAAAAQRFDAGQALTPDPGVGHQQSVSDLKAVAAAALDARQQSDALNQSLLSVGQQRIQIAFQIQSAETDIANMQFDQQQALANQAENRAMQIAEQTAALTISLNQFKAAEQSAQIRAFEREQSFVAFRPDNALVRADQERRYQRDREQEIARNARTNALAERQLTNQKAIAAFELDNLGRQERETADRLKLFNLEHDDVVSKAQSSLRQLQAATIAQQTAATGQHVTLDVTVKSPDFSEAQNAEIRNIMIRVIGEEAGKAISLVRSRPRGMSSGRIDPALAP